MQKANNDASLLLSVEALQTLFDDVQQRNTIEACGVLLGSIDDEGNWIVEEARPLRNTAESPVYFEFAPEELLTAELTHPAQSIVGVYHSHPTGYPMASDTDRNNMERVNLQQHIPWAWLIVCGPFAGTYTTDNLPPMIAYHHYETGLQEITIKMAI